ADHSAGQPLGQAPPPRRGVPVRAGRPRLRPAPGLRRGDHRYLSLEAAGRGEALRVGGGGRDLHSAQHDPAAFQCRPEPAGAADLGDQPHLQGLRAERPGADRGRAGVPAQHRRHSRIGGKLFKGQGNRLSAVLPASRASAWRELWLITVGHTFTHWYPATFYLLLPLIGAELGLSYSQIDLIITCQYTATAIDHIPGGIIVDTIG